MDDKKSKLLYNLHNFYLNLLLYLYQRRLLYWLHSTCRYCKCNKKFEDCKISIDNLLNNYIMLFNFNNIDKFIYFLKQFLIIK